MRSETPRTVNANSGYSVPYEVRLQDLLRASLRSSRPFLKDLFGPDCLRLALWPIAPLASSFQSGVHIELEVEVWGVVCLGPRLTKCLGVLRHCYVLPRLSKSEVLGTAGLTMVPYSNKSSMAFRAFPSMSRSCHPVPAAIRASAYSSTASCAAFTNERNSVSFSFLIITLSDDVSSAWIVTLNA